MAAPRPESASVPFAAAILCGGTSRRLGTDKAALDVGGRPLAVAVARVARAAGANPVAAIGPSASVAAAVRLDGFGVLADRWPGEGPAAAVVTAFALTPAGGAGAHSGARVDLVAVLGCDYPRLGAATIVRLVERLAGEPELAAVVAEAGGRLHPTIGVWRASACAGVGGAYVLDGQRSLVGLARAVGAVGVAVDADEVADVDTPADAAALGLVASLPPQRRGTGTLREPGSPDVAASTTSRGDPDVSSEADLPAIAVAALAALGDDVAVFDVRQPDEYEEGHVPGAVLIPLGDVPDRVGEFPAEGTVYVVCRSGGRSASAVEFLRSAGIDAVNVEGGTMAWIEAGHPVATGSEPG